MKDARLRAAREYGLPRWRSEMTIRRCSSTSVSIVEVFVDEGLPDRRRRCGVGAVDDAHQPAVRQPQPAAQTLHHFDGEGGIVTDPEHEASWFDDEYARGADGEGSGIA